MKREIKDAADYEALYKREKLKYIGLSAAGIIFLSIWEISVRTGLVNPSKLVPPSQILAGCYKNYGIKAGWGHADAEPVCQPQVVPEWVWDGNHNRDSLGLLMGWYKPVQKLVNPILN